MYVSGELKEKTIEFLKKDMINFDKEGISTEKLYMSYYGEIRVPPWENNYLTKLKKRQEDLIAAKEEDIKFLTDLKFPLIHIEICRLLQIIFQTSRKTIYKPPHSNEYLSAPTAVCGKIPPKSLRPLP